VWRAPLVAISTIAPAYSLADGQGTGTLSRPGVPIIDVHVVPQMAERWILMRTSLVPRWGSGIASHPDTGSARGIDEAFMFWDRLSNDAEITPAATERLD